MFLTPTHLLQVGKGQGPGVGIGVLYTDVAMTHTGNWVNTKLLIIKIMSVSKMLLEAQARVRQGLARDGT